MCSQRRRLQSGCTQPWSRRSIARRNARDGVAHGGGDPEEHASLVGGDADLGVAGEEPGDGVGDDLAEVELARSEGAVGMDVVVEHDLVALTAVAGALQRGIEGVVALVDEPHERIRPRHAWT